MNEEQAILEFFAKTENLSLGLSVAELMDKLREQMNNRFWVELQSRLETLIKEHGLAWRLEPTEDRNAPDCLVGLHCYNDAEQPHYLRPMVEQQYMGGEWRIYYGLMWSAVPLHEQLGLAAVKSLKASLQNAGLKNNENFLAWQWTAFHPRRKDFLLRYAHRPEQVLDEMEHILKKLLIDHGTAIAQANEVLCTSPQRSLHASLNQLRKELLDN
jgi:hypothetical protein